MGLLLVPLTAHVWLYLISESLEERDCDESSNLSESTFSVLPVFKELVKLYILFRENKLLIGQKIFMAQWHIILHEVLQLV